MKKKKTTYSRMSDKLVCYSIDEMTKFVGDVEYSTITAELRSMGAIEKLGYDPKKNLATTAIYTFVRLQATDFGSVVSVGTYYFYPKNKIRQAIQAYFDKLDSKPITVDNPELAELIRKLKAKPELTNALLELVN